MPRSCVVLRQIERTCFKSCFLCRFLNYNFLFMQDKAASKQELLHLIHTIYARGWAPATSTNYSFRNPEGNTYTISRSGVDKGLFALDDFMEINADGMPLPAWAHVKPSAETGIHTTLYKNPDIRAILHTHSPASTVLSYLRRGDLSIPIQGFEVLKGLDGITSHETRIEVPLFDNDQDMERLGDRIQATLPNYPRSPCLLLAGHGLYVWGKSLTDAKRHLEVFEYLFECILRMEGKSLI